MQHFTSECDVRHPNAASDVSGCCLNRRPPPHLCSSMAIAAVPRTVIAHVGVYLDAGSLTQFGQTEKATLCANHELMSKYKDKFDTAIQAGTKSCDECLAKVRLDGGEWTEAYYEYRLVDAQSLAIFMFLEARRILTRAPKKYRKWFREAKERHLRQLAHFTLSPQSQRAAFYRNFRDSDRPTSAMVTAQFNALDDQRSTEVRLLPLTYSSLRRFCSERLGPR